MARKHTPPQIGLPEGWDRARTEAVIRHYEDQDEDQAVAEDEAARNGRAGVWMQIPADKLAAVRSLLAHSTSSSS